MKTEEIRRILETVMKELDGPREIEVAGNVIQVWLRKRTEHEAISAGEKAEEVYAKAYKRFFEDTCGEESSRAKYSAHDIEDLVEMMGGWRAFQQQGQGFDLFDDLQGPDLSEEKREEEREKRFKTWLEDQKKELAAKPKEELVEMLVKRDAEICGRSMQAVVRADLTIVQCVVDEDRKPVFKDVDDLRSLLTGRLLENLRTDTRTFLAAESLPTARKVAESPDFPGSTDSG